MLSNLIRENNSKEDKILSFKLLHIIFMILSNRLYSIFIEGTKPLIYKKKFPATMIFGKFKMKILPGKVWFWGINKFIEFPFSEDQRTLAVCLSQLSANNKL